MDISTRTLDFSRSEPAESFLSRLKLSAGESASMMELPSYLRSLRYNISEQADIAEVYFLFDLTGFPESAMIYYPRVGEGDEEAGELSEGTRLPILLVRENRHATIGLFRSASEAVATLAMTTQGLDFNFDPEISVNQLAASFLEFCVENNLVAQRHDQEAAGRELRNLRRALLSDESRAKV